MKHSHYHLRYKVGEYVRNKFKDHKRKFTNLEYSTHLFSVAELAHSHDIFFGYEIGLLHDLYEDTDVKPHECIEFLVKTGYNKIDASFISDTVLNLTKYYTDDKWKKYSKQELNELETKRILESNEITQSVKYCDIIDNIQHNIWFDKIYKQYDFKYFIKSYLPLKKRQLELMDSGNKKLRKQAMDLMDKNYEYFKIT